MKHSEKGFFLTPGRLLLVVALLALVAVLLLVVGIATTYNKVESVRNPTDEQTTTVEILSPDGRTAATAVVDRPIVLADGNKEKDTDGGGAPIQADPKPIEKKAIHIEQHESVRELMPSAARQADAPSASQGTVVQSVGNEQRELKNAVADDEEQRRLEQQRAERVAQAKAELAERAKARAQQQERQTAVEAQSVPSKPVSQKEIIDNLF
ncbi:MAG: hypothetical protein Q4A49_04065 [Neisseria sp.]|nr:hypothetical protein [Neisseria sp.]